MDQLQVHHLGTHTRRVSMILPTGTCVELIIIIMALCEQTATGLYEERNTWLPFAHRSGRELEDT